MQSLAPTTPTTERLHGLDAVRGFALLLGVLLHASMSWLPGAQYFWTTHDGDPSMALSLAFYVPHMFRMLLFFLIAGFFGRMVLERIGVKRFIRDRLKRIGVPLLVGWPLVFSTIVAILIWSAMLANGGTLPTQSPPGPAFTPDDFPLTHLWFLYVLLLCYVAVLALRGMIVAVDRNGRLHAAGDMVARVLASAGGPVLLALPLAASLVLQPNWFMWFGIPTPDRSLYPNLAAVVGFGGAFALGWLLHRQPTSLCGWARRWHLHLAVALIATGICLGIVGISPNLTPAPARTTEFIYAACYALAAWSWTFAIMGLGLRFLSNHSATRRYLADASYWIYLVHLPLVMALQVVASRLAWPWPIELGLLLATAFAIMLASYHLLVRFTFIGAILNGRRKPRQTQIIGARSPSPNLL